MHFLVPLAVAVGFYRPRWLAYFGILLLGLLIDVDHLLASPIYDAGRCSIGFHPLHTLVPIGFYVALLLPPKTRVLGMGLCIHVVLDMSDCYVNTGSFFY